MLKHGTLRVKRELLLSDIIMHLNVQILGDYFKITV